MAALGFKSDGLKELWSRLRFVLLAIIIAYIPLFIAFYCMSVSPMTNMGIGDFAVDIVMFGLAGYTYFKPKN